MTVTPMWRAIELARIARGTTSPNPPVGAVLVNNGVIVGEGFTQPPGNPHAEIVALRSAGNSARGATLFVTLEPCTHWGRTPPCVDALIEAGISAGHIATLDPNPVVHGQGVERLHQAGIDVLVGECSQEALELIEAHATLIREGRPLVTVLSDLPAAARRAEEAIADVRLDSSGGERISVQQLLRELARREIASVTVPATDPLSDALLNAGVVDRIVTGPSARPPAGFKIKKREMHPVHYAVYVPTSMSDDPASPASESID